MTAVDASLEVIELNRERTQSDKINYLQENLFKWQAKEKYDFIFFSFWLSHVPPERFKVFWQSVADALAPNGRVFLIDSLHKKEATSKDQILPAQDGTVAKRKLKDGREFEIVKIFYQPERLKEQLSDLGWKVKAKKTKNFFVYAEATK